jgi:hypothetical protein
MESDEMNGDLPEEYDPNLDAFYIRAIESIVGESGRVILADPDDLELDPDVKYLKWYLKQCRKKDPLYLSKLHERGEHCFLIYNECGEKILLQTSRTKEEMGKDIECIENLCGIGFIRTRNKRLCLKYLTKAKDNLYVNMMH